MNIQTVTYNGLSFVNVHDPHELEIKYLRKNFGFNPLNLEDYINKTQIPKIEIYKGYSLVVLDFPYVENPFPTNGNNTSSHQQQKKSFFLSQVSLPPLPLPQFATAKRKRLLAGQVDLFIGKEYLVVLHDERTPQIEEVFAFCQKTLRHRQDFMGEGSVFLFYRIVDILVDSMFNVVNELSARIDTIDKQIDQQTSPLFAVEEISAVRRDLVVFQTMVKPVLPIFSDLEKGTYKELNDSMTPFWSNILDHLQKIWARLEDNRELVEGISESNESLLSARTNEIIKVLTLFSAIILPLNLLASMYGMNLPLPFANNISAFGVITFIMLIIGFGMFFIFKLRHWL